MADTVANIADLNSGRIEVEKFFKENYVTDGMRTLLTQVFDRLLGNSPQGVFQLKQAMGGGAAYDDMGWDDCASVLNRVELVSRLQQGWT